MQGFGFRVHFRVHFRVQGYLATLSSSLLLSSLELSDTQVYEPYLATHEAAALAKRVRGRPELVVRGVTSRCVSGLGFEHRWCATTDHSENS